MVAHTTATTFGVLAQLVKRLSGIERDQQERQKDELLPLGHLLWDPGY